MSAKSILVTGASGFVGRHTAAALSRRGHAVTGLDVRPRPTWLDTPFLQADVVNAAEMVRSGGFDFVVHNAAITDTTEMDVDWLRITNTEAPLILAEACSAGGATLIYASSFSVYGAIANRSAVSENDVDEPSLCSGPLNPYADSKLATDRALAANPPSARCIGLRYTNVVGSDEHDKGRMASILSQMISRAVRGEEILLFSDTLEAARDYLPVEAVASVVASCVDDPPPSGVYNLGSGVAVTFATLLEWARTIQPAISVRLIDNIHASRYQYWTCADLTKLRSAIPDVEAWDEVSLRTAALDIGEEVARSSAQ